jgi:hypothetical protein
MGPPGAGGGAAAGVVGDGAVAGLDGAERGVGASERKARHAKTNKNSSAEMTAMIKTTRRTVTMMVDQGSVSDSVRALSPSVGADGCGW